MSAEKILENMLEFAKENNISTTKNVDKIARAKNMMFGEEEWKRCPCDGQNPDRYCGSTLCMNDIKEKGICHCNCYTPLNESKK